jgi:hypothetical protein
LDFYYVWFDPAKQRPKLIGEMIARDEISGCLIDFDISFNF